MMTLAHCRKPRSACRKSSRLPTTEADLGFISLRQNGKLEVALETEGLGGATATAVVADAAGAAASALIKVRAEVLKSDRSESSTPKGLFPSNDSLDDRRV